MPNQTANDRPTKSAAKAASRTRAGAARTRGVQTRKTASAASPRSTRKQSTRTRTSAAGTRADTRSTAALAGDYAERAVLIPVGVALSARDAVVAGVNDVIDSYSSPTKAQTQLRKFERRGHTARNRLEREVRKTRTRIERELRERRRELEHRREDATKRLTAQVEQTQSQIEKTQGQIENALRTRLEDGADLANRLQERLLNLV